ncbi:MAG TPA: hypothetical protein VFS01_10145, partial [Rhizomicrobium sp.]|nr:hypothetical protein [Rhizomicrobium sp.]
MTHAKRPPNGGLLVSGYQSTTFRICPISVAFAYIFDKKAYSLVAVVGASMNDSKRLFLMLCFLLVASGLALL